ncbi:signal transduction histidine kinase [Streptomyces sp. SLBN-118]|uniref:sensor histidine kinase n=1 Tax=Streptomyces sp. SLBN-118 TaxID=2768454 RepID=UPI001152EB41|nr:histidine kinase [Streptomyces sp. SLBN-118]TQK52175.1 signal transduction histidine kinase [Streptomyces sp. SLBN-118]
MALHHVPTGPAGTLRADGLLGVASEVAVPAEPALKIQLSALQAMCRQVFGFRLAMIALATPFAVVGAASGWPTLLVGIAILATFMGSYVLFRDWERFGPLLLRHPWLLGIDAFFGALLLITATPASPLSYVTICTPLLAGLVYGWRGAGVFAALTILIIFAAYAANSELHVSIAGSTLLPGLCAVLGAVGVSLRQLMLGFGTATQALSDVRSRLAVTEAVQGERARLAREMHDSVAKTLHGVAMAADGLASSADRMDPLTVKHQSEVVARSARRAAAESRELLSDLRRQSDIEAAGVDVAAELSARTDDFARRTGMRTTWRTLGDLPVPEVPHAVARHLLTIASEAMENAHRHARPTCIDVSVGVVDRALRISIYDDGCGLPPGTSLDDLRKASHFGLVGMVERAAGIGARIRIGRGRATKGTEVRLEIPVNALSPSGLPAAVHPPLTHQPVPTDLSPSTH